MQPTTGRRTALVYHDVTSRAKSLAAAILFVVCAIAAITYAAGDTPDRIESAVVAAIQPVMAKYRIPGMAVAITIAGKSSVYNYGAASTETRQPVTRDTFVRNRIDNQDIHRDAGILCTSLRLPFAVRQDE